ILFSNDGGTTSAFDNLSANPGYLFISNAVTQNLMGNFSNSGKLELWANTMAVAGNYSNTGNTQLDRQVTLTVDGSFTNGPGSAEFQLLFYANTANIGGALTNDGYLRVDTGSAINVTDGLTNVDSSGNLTTANISGATYLLNGGTLFYHGNSITNIGSGVTVTLNNPGGLG